MKLEDQLCSLELAKKLKALGVPQESLFSYILYKTSQGHIELSSWAKSQYGGIGPIETELISLYTVAELGEMLKCWDSRSDMSFMPMFSKRQKMWNTLSDGDFAAKNEADTRAMIVIQLIEDGVLKAEDLRI